MDKHYGKTTAAKICSILVHKTQKVHIHFVRGKQMQFRTITKNKSLSSNKKPSVNLGVISLNNTD